MKAQTAHTAQDLPAFRLFYLMTTPAEVLGRFLSYDCCHRAIQWSEHYGR